MLGPKAHDVARRVGVDGVFFAGWRGHDDLPHGLAACDVVVMPLGERLLPQAPLEASPRDGR